MPRAPDLNLPASSLAAPWRGQPRKGETMIQKKEENGEKYATATTEAEFHEAR